MKKLIILLFCLLIVSLGFAKEIKINDNQNTVTVIKSDDFSTIIDYEIGSFNTKNVKINGETFNQVSVKKGHYFYKKGEPDLPGITKSIIIPNNAKMKIYVIESDFVEYSMKIAPSKGKILRTIDPSTVPYEFSNTYTNNEFYPSELSNLGTPYILRDFRGITVTVSPFEYNPITQILRVYHHIKVEVTNSGIDTENILNTSKDSYSKYFESVYANHFINFSNAKYELVDEHGRMIVICYPNFIDAVQPYVEWKRQKGMDVQVYDVSEIGSANNIRSFIQNQYNQDDDLTFVQLIGDAAQVPTLSSGGGGSDPKYALVAGGDAYMDIFIGRFSAENVAQVETQVQRSVWYERDIQDGAWLEKGFGVASSQGTGDDNEYDYAHQDVIRQKLLGYGYTQVDQLYDTNGVNAAAVAEALNEGRGIGNYTGHGSSTSWVSSGFNIQNVNNLTNDFMLPFIQSVACVNGDFTYGTCFAEAWLRATHDGNPTGAIAFFGSSINQSWAPPMAAQDESIDMITGSVNYNGTPEVMKTIGGLWYNGEGEMLDLYNDNAMSETWHIFGDASLMVRTKIPQEMNVAHSGALFIGVSTYSVNVGVEDAQVALYNDGILYASGYTDASGVINLNIENPPTQPMDLTLTVTAFNKKTYIGTVSVIPNDGPYVIMSNCSITTSDGDDIIEFGETVNVSVTLENVGSDDAENVILTMDNLEDLVTFTDNTENFGTIVANGSVTLDNCLSFVVSESIANDTALSLTGDIVSGVHNWDTLMSFIGYSPILEIGGIVINDNENGRLDPGETADIAVTFENIGGASVNNLSVLLSSNDTFITINTASATLSQIGAGASGAVSFNVTAAENTEVGHNVTFNLVANGDNNYTYTENFNISVGLNLEDFETGDFSAHPWEFNGIANWTISNSAYEGDYAAQSGSIDDSQESALELTLNVLTDSQISFYYKVSSEENYDYFHFYIDNNDLASWAGDIDWSQASYDVTPGMHTFKWEYTKDGSVSHGDDCAWLDYIILPSAAPTGPPNFVITPDSLYVVLPENGTAEESIILSNNGGGTVNYIMMITGDDNPSSWLSLSQSVGDVEAGESDNVIVTFSSNNIEWGNIYTCQIRVTDDTGRELTIIPVTLAYNGSENGSDQIPLVTKLSGNYPNPFNPETTIAYQINKAAKVQIDIYNIRGQHIKTLVNTNQAPGYYKKVWNGKDHNGKNVSSGVYFYKFRAGNDYTYTRKMILMK